MARASGVHPNAQHFPVDPSLWESVKAQVPLRHPSQIYQALCEGLAVFILLWFLRRRFETRGMIGAAFLIAYGAARFPMEWFRQPDAQFESGNSMSGWGEFLHTLHLTQGQLLCLGMIVAGAICAYFFKRSSNPYKRIDALDRSLRGEAMVELPKD